MDLKVPYSEKDAAKQLGAQWNAITKTWYIEDHINPEPFKRWLSIIPGKKESLASVQQNIEIITETKSIKEHINLSAFLNNIKKSFQQHCAHKAWVVAEIADVKNRNGHCYLDLVEYVETISTVRIEKAKIKANIWADKVEAIKSKFFSATDTIIAKGMKIMLLVTADYHIQFGISLSVLDIDPNYTLGDLEANLKKIRASLKAEGIAEKNKSLPVPDDFTQIAVITPKAAAGLGDFQKEAKLLQRHGLCQFDYYEATFQGKDASRSIQLSLKQAVNSKFYDAIVILRGGGAITDLAWLNDLELARSVCDSPIPIFTGIGHEKDKTILDEVACCSYDTPSKVILSIMNKICNNADQANKNFTKILHETRQVIGHFDHKLNEMNQFIKSQANQKLQIITSDIQRFGKAIHSAKDRLDDIEEKTTKCFQYFSSLSQSAINSSLKQARQFHNTIMRISYIRLNIKDKSLDDQYQAIFKFSESVLCNAQNTVTSLSKMIMSQAENVLRSTRNRLNETQKLINAQSKRTLDTIVDKVESYILQIMPQDPKNTLKRGFTLTRNSEGNKILHSYTEALSEVSLEIEFQDGKLKVLTQNKEQ